MKKARIFIYICALCLLISNVTIMAVDTSALNITNHTVSKSHISPDDSFDLTFDLKNESGSDLTDVNYTINSSNFKLKQGSTVKTIGSMTDGEIKTEKMSLIYTGGDDKTITITVQYDTDKQTVNTIYIDEARTDSNNNSEPIETSKYKPELTIINKEIPTGETGATFNLGLKIKNDSNQTAKDIKAELITPDDLKIDLINTINMVQNIKELKSKETSDLNYSFLVRSNTEAKTYRCTLKYTYYNLFGDKTEASQDFYIKVTKGYPFIDLNVSDVSTIPAIIQAGEKVELSFLVNNHGGLTKVSKVDVSLDGLSQNGFSLMDGVNSKMVYDILPLSEGGKVSFNLYASSKMEKGSYPLTVNLTYTDESNVKQTVEKTVYLMVDTGISSSVSIQNVESPIGQITNDQLFNVSFDIINTGANKAEDLIVTVKSGDEIVPMSQNIHIINDLDVNAKKHLTFKFQPTAEATTKSHLLNIEVKGKNEESFTTINQYVGVYVKHVDNDTTNDSKPNIIIDSYEINSHGSSPSIVDAGENFDLEISFQNTHKNKKVENIKIYLTAEENTSQTSQQSGSVFTPVNSSNTFFIDDIAPKQSVSRNLTLFTIPYAASKTHTIQVNLEYEDNTGKQYTATELISVPVVQPSSFITSDINIPEMIFVGEPINLSLEVSNTGKTSLDNFTVLIEGFGSSNSKTYLGNLEPGRTTYYDGDLWANEEGEVTGNLIFTYTKPDGKPAEVKKEIKTMARAMEINQGGDMNMGDMDFPPMPEEKKSSNTKKLIIIISSIAVVAIIVTIVIIRKIKKKKELSFDE